MTINKIMRAALAALSHPEIDIKKTYPLARELDKIKAWRFKKTGLYRILEQEISSKNHKVPVRIFTPIENKNNKVLLFFHGGGWVTGNIDSYNGVCSDRARITGGTVASVDYRLAPEYKFPCGLEDCYAAAKEIFHNSKLFETEADNIILIGDSAGGNLASAVSMLARDKKDFFPKKQILIYPLTSNNHSETSPYKSVKENGTGYLLTSKNIEGYMELYISKKEDIENPYLAPLLAKSFSNLPKTLIITAEFCPLRDEGEEYGRKINEAGGCAKIVRIPDVIHGYFSLPVQFKPVKETYGIIKSFIEE